MITVYCTALPVGVKVCIGNVLYVGTLVMEGEVCEDSDISPCINRDAG